MIDASLHAVLDQSWALLASGVASRKSPMHAPVVSTIDETGWPSQRVMVLREANRDTRKLRFHTDSRSAKVGEVERINKVNILAYDPDAAIQLRITGMGYTENDGNVADAAWESSTLFARRCYLAELAPGQMIAQPKSGLPDWIEGKMPTPDQIKPARANFAVLKIDVLAIEWLHLANTGHRRAKLNFVDDAWLGNWLIP